jgi:DNA-binding MarR family transcriptional regulator
MSFDAIVSSPGRLKILTALAHEPRRAFVEVRRATGLTDGNLTTHARRLQSAGFVTIHKSIESGKPLTTLQITRDGRAALEAHARSLRAALETQPPVEVAVENHSGDDWVD